MTFQSKETIKITTTCEEFIGSNEMKVMVIKGSWGIGKTYQWNTFINSCLDGKLPSSEILKHQLNSYSYVSLFGLQDIQQVKDEISLNEIDLKDPQKSQKWRKRLRQNRYVETTLNTVKDKYKGAGNIIGLMDSMLNTIKGKCLVCIDDVERKSPKLATDQVMGLVDWLVNQKKCKVVLLFNEDKLDASVSSSESNYRVYREKLVDLEYEYLPPIEHNFDLIFNEVSDPERSFILDISNRIGIRNIRIYKKIKWVVDNFTVHLSSVREPVKKEFIYSAVFVTWAYFDLADRKLFDDIFRIFDRSTLSGSEIIRQMEEATENHSEGMEIVRQLKYQTTGFENFIRGFLRNGFLIEQDKLTSFVAKRDDDHLLDQVKSEYKKLWDLYYDSFDDNESEFADNLKAFADTNGSYLGLHDLDSMLDYLAEDDSKKYIAKFLKNNQHLIDKEDLSFITGKIKNKLLIIEREKLINNLSPVTFDQAISGYKEGSWSPEQIEFLLSLNVDDIYRWLKSKPDDLVAKVRQGLLKFKGTPDLATISKKTIEALILIAKENSFNATRVKNLYGINIENVLTKDEFFELHQPIKNEFNGEAIFKGTLFSPSGKEYEHVREHVEGNLVWTVFEKIGFVRVLPGDHNKRNTLGYFVCKVPYTKDDVIARFYDEDLGE